ncbi:FAD-binding protein [Salmonella enterica]|nr:FAD-binding protein [Salmonella enterica]
MIYDVIIIGSGISGSALSFIAKEYGLKVAVVEKDLIGGDISRYGGAAALVFGEDEVLEVNKITESYFQEFWMQGAPIFNRKCLIRTNEKRFFPFAKFDKKGNLNQSCFVANPADLAKWILFEKIRGDIDIYEGIEAIQIDYKEHTLLLSTGTILSFKKIFLSTGNGSIGFMSSHHQKTNILYKKLNLVLVDGLDLDNEIMNFYHDIDCYDFYLPYLDKRAFCFPINNFVDFLPNNSRDYRLNTESLFLANTYLKELYSQHEYKIVGARTYYEVYTNERLPNIKTDDRYSCIVFFNGFSGSGLRLSFGYAKKIIRDLFP